jgi:hypothetical protein
MNDCFKAWFTHPTKVILFGSMWLFLDINASLTFLNIVLKGLKQDKYNGYNACDVCDGNVIMFNPKKMFILFLSRVTWLPCLSKINKFGCWRTIRLELIF